jgi:hypothetical protein
MRFFSVALLLVAAVTALPNAGNAEVAFKANAAEARAAPLADKRSADDAPILDARIDAHQAEGRSVNLSPQNNRRMGRF